MWNEYKLKQYMDQKQEFISDLNLANKQINKQKTLLNSHYVLIYKIPST